MVTVAGAAALSAAKTAATTTTTAIPSSLGGGAGTGAGVATGTGGASAGGGGGITHSRSGRRSHSSTIPQQQLKHQQQQQQQKHTISNTRSGHNIKASASRNSNIRSSSSNSTMASSNHRGGGVGGGVGGSSGLQIGSAWFQRKINLRPQHRGVHLVTEEILRQMPELGQFSVGLCHVQILHTSASLALNESWDPDVRDDMEMMLNKIVPEGLPYRHSCEGPDDMPAHVKACFLGSSLTIPITDGKLSLGTWQGVWLCEHRDQAGSRKLVITLSGCPRETARSPLSPVSPIASTSS